MALERPFTATAGAAVAGCCVACHGYVGQGARPAAEYHECDFDWHEHARAVRHIVDDQQAQGLALRATALQAQQPARSESGQKQAQQPPDGCPSLAPLPPSEGDRRAENMADSPPFLSAGSESGRGTEGCACARVQSAEVLEPSREANGSTVAAPAAPGPVTKKEVGARDANRVRAGFEAVPAQPSTHMPAPAANPHSHAAAPANPGAVHHTKSTSPASISPGIAKTPSAAAVLASGAPASAAAAAAVSTPAAAAATPESPASAYEGSKWEEFYRAHPSARFFKERRYLLLEFPDLLRCEHVAEIGCGCGSSILPVLKANPGSRTTCTDISTTCLDQLLAAAAAEGIARERLAVFPADATDPAAAPAFEAVGADALLIMFTLSAVTPQQQAVMLHHAWRALRPGGRLMIRDHGLYDMVQLRIPADQWVGPNLYKRGDGTMAFFFSTEELALRANGVGFDTEECKYVTVVNRNRKTGMELRRVFVHGVFVKPRGASADG